jgi:hypothetical protein
MRRLLGSDGLRTNCSGERRVLPELLTILDDRVGQFDPNGEFMSAL